MQKKRIAVGMRELGVEKVLPYILGVFINRKISRILGINMIKVRYMRIKNTSIRIMFYNIPCILNQVAFQQLSYVCNIFRHEEYHVPTRLLTAWSNHPRKRGRPLLKNKMSLARNLRLIIPNVEDTGSLSGWGFHALDTGHWRNLLATLKHPANTTPDGPPNTPDVDRDVPPYSNTE